jgi:hypothetical protein
MPQYKYVILFLLIILLLPSTYSNDDPFSGGSETVTTGEKTPEQHKLEKLVAERGGIRDGKGINQVGSDINIGEGRTGSTTFLNAEMSEEQLTECEKKYPKCEPCREGCMNAEAVEQVNDPWAEWDNLYDFYSGEPRTHA